MQDSDGKIILSKDNYDKAMRYIDKMIHDAVKMSAERTAEAAMKRIPINSGEKIRELIISPVFEEADIKFRMFMDFLKETKHTETAITLTENSGKYVREKYLDKRRSVLMKIEPRKLTNQGGYYCMPLVKNVPHGHSDWKLTTCPECRRDCWRMPLADIAEAMGANPLCTECALKKGAVKS